jgi:hypothetical protein
MDKGVYSKMTTGKIHHLANRSSSDAYLEGLTLNTALNYSRVSDMTLFIELAILGMKMFGLFIKEQKKCLKELGIPNNRLFYPIRMLDTFFDNAFPLSIQIEDLLHEYHNNLQ